MVFLHRIIGISLSIDTICREISGRQTPRGELRIAFENAASFEDIVRDLKDIIYQQ